MPAAIPAVIGAAGAIGGGLLASSGAKSAASTQAQAANNAAALQFQQFQQIQQNLQPYMQLGTSYIPRLNDLLNSGDLSQRFSFNPTQEQLESTPGYQFSLKQGLNTVNNQLASKGLNLSGAQARGIADYATGLASNTYQQQYENALKNFQTNYGVAQNQFGQLTGLIGLGENAAAGVGNAGLQTAANAGNLMTQGANAQAAGSVGSANALGGALNGVGNSALLYSLLNNSSAPSSSGSGSNIYGFLMPGLGGGSN